MANTSSARKCARQSARNRQHNIALLSRFRTAVKNVVKAIDKGDKAAAVEAYQKAVPVIDSSADKGYLHRNKAARHKSRLNAAIRRLA